MIGAVLVFYYLFCVLFVLFVVLVNSVGIYACVEDGALCDYFSFVFVCFDLTSVCDFTVTEACCLICVICVYFLFCLLFWLVMLGGFHLLFGWMVVSRVVYVAVGVLLLWFLLWV